MNKKGFTLIELLAVIIILGILMIIAIPSVTKYINDSRKSAYIDTAKEIVGGTRNIVNEGKLGMYDTGITYYIPASYVNTENALKSPYGEFPEKAAYVGVIYDGIGYNYYWISSDDTGQGIDEVTPFDKLDIDLIKSDINPNDIYDTVSETGIGNRKIVKVLENGVWVTKTENAGNMIPENGGNSSNSIKYPSGKTKETVVAGDKVTIGSEEFYVIKHDGDDLVLLARYNLKVGGKYQKTSDEISSNYEKVGEYTSSDPGYGRQSSETRGYVYGTFGVTTYNGGVPFSNTDYWYGSNYSGVTCDYHTLVPGVTCKYIYYDNNHQFDPDNTIHQYVDSYRDYLLDIGVSVKEARLLKVEEFSDIACNSSSGCDEDINIAYSWLYETSYWLGSYDYEEYVWIINSEGFINNFAYYVDDMVGVRPVIVI